MSSRGAAAVRHNNEIRVDSNLKVNVVIRAEFREPHVEFGEPRSNSTMAPGIQVLPPPRPVTAAEVVRRGPPNKLRARSGGSFAAAACMIGVPPHYK